MEREATKVLFCLTGTRELLHKGWREGGRKEGRSFQGGGGGWKRRGGRRRRRPHQGLAGQLLPQGPDMTETFILAGRVTQGSNEEETGRTTEEGRTLNTAEEEQQRGKEAEEYRKHSEEKVSILPAGTCTLHEITESGSDFRSDTVMEVHSL